jgi:hypothetical protein
MTDTKLLKNLLQQIEHLSDDQLYAGLTVLSKDVLEHLETTRSTDELQTPIKEALSREEDYWRDYGSPLYESLSMGGLPHGFTRQTAETLDLSPLHDPSIIHEWTLFPGQDLFNKFKEKFKEVICGEGGPYEKFEEDLVGQDDLPVTIASSILAAGISVATFWYPLAIYFGLLLVRAGLKTYCEI